MNKKVIINGLFYLETKDNKIRFTTNNPDFKQYTLGEILKKLYKKFGITKIKIEMHLTPEGTSDTDIIVTARNKKKINEIEQYILMEFYKTI
jgi:hypothetical protein